MTTASLLRERAALCTHPLTKRLLEIMELKETNLCVAADLIRSQDLLTLADAIGPEICVLKTHIDILEDFTPDVAHSLQLLADKHQFLLFEDRKFADIGNTVLSQYQGGIYQISKWAHLTNAHILPGPGIIEGLKKEGLPKGRGLLLLAEMSSQGNFFSKTYTEEAVKLALEHPDFVIGFIAQHKLSQDPTLIHFTPGIQIKDKTDGLGQQFTSPEEALKKGSDVLIVGRGIYQAEDPIATATHYRKTCWSSRI